MNGRLKWAWLGRCVALGWVFGGGGGYQSLSAQHAAVATQSVSDDARETQELMSKRVTITLTNVTRAVALDSISRVTEVFVQYYTQTFEAFPELINLRVESLPLSEVLEKVLEGTGLRVASDGPGVLFVMPRNSVAQDSVPGVGTLSGRVVDSATGLGLTGVTVKVTGTKLAVLTQDSGRFMLRDVPAGEHLVTAKVFAYRPVGRTVDVSAGGTATLHITLVPVPTVLSGVVTTATGQQRKIEVGNDITTLNVDSIRQIAPITSVTDLLETRVPGLTVLHSSGVPGDPARLRLRGVGSIQLNNDPILIVDGVRMYANQSDPRNDNLAPTIGDNNRTSNSNSYITNATAKSQKTYAAPSPLDQIDPNNIETIEVLKGPSATATYGSDAANGVIVVTTKHGRTGPPHWNVAMGGGTSWLPGTWPTHYYRFGATDGLSMTSLCAWSDPSCLLDSVVAFQALNDSRYTVLSHGSDRRANVSISGGNSTFLYSLTGDAAGTLGYLKLPAVEQQRYDSLYGAVYGSIPGYLVRPDWYRTWSVGGSVTAQPYPTLYVTVQSSLFSGYQQRGALESAINQLQGAYISGDLTYSSTDGAFAGPLIQQEFERVTDDQLTSTNAASLHWQPRPWLPIDANAGISMVQRTDLSYVPFGIYDGVYVSGIADGQHLRDTTGSYGLGRGTSRNQTLTLGTVIPLARQRVRVSVGGNMYTASTNDFHVYTDQLAAGVTVPTSFTTICSGNVGDVCNSPTSQSTSGQSTYGWYVEPRLNVASRFFVAPGFRLDGGSGGAHGSSLGGLSAFPKMNFSYVAVDRQGEQPLWGFLSMLRPRLAFGLAGTQPGPDVKLRLYNVGSYTLYVSGGALTGTSSCAPLVTLDGTTQVPAVCLAALGNTVLRPERSKEVEGGLDASLWHDRLSVTYTQYNKTRHDAILAVPVAPSVFSVSGAGGSTIEKNVGVIRNTGTEVTLTATVLERRAFGWTIGANLSNNQNLVVSLNKGQLPIVYGGGVGNVETRVQAGYSLFGMFAKPITGFADVNHNGIIETNEISIGDSAVYIGQSAPNYQLNLTNDVSLLNGRLSLHATVAYQQGMTQTNDGACTSTGFALLPNAPNTPLATQAAVVTSGCDYDISIADPSRTKIGLAQTVSTLRLNDLSINYTVPTMFANWFRVPRMTVALQGSNLGLHTNYRGIDPNVNAFSTVSGAEETADLGQIPEPRTWSLRITLGN